MSDWLGTWIATAAKNSVNGEFCKIGEAWGNCFMRLTYYGNDELKIDCTSLATNATNAACPYVSPRNRRGIMAGPDGVQIWYAAYAIWFYHQFIARIYQQFPTHGEGPYFSVPPADVLRVFLEREAYPGYDHFVLLNSALVRQMNYANEARLWTTLDIAGIQTGLLAVLNYTMTDFWTEMGRFDDVARQNAAIDESQQRGGGVSENDTAAES
ncbi:MAG: hypothetical protein Q9171_004075 [Xanthocarpia ochracea]